MRIGKMALACAIASALCVSKLSAQQPASSQGTYPVMSYPGANTKLVGYEYTNYYAAEEPASPSDAAPASAAPAAPCEAAPCESNPCESTGCDNRPCCCKPSACDNLHTFLRNGFRTRCSTGSEPGGYSPPYTSLPWQQEDDWAPVHLFENNCFLKKHSIDVGGWLAQGYVMNPQSPADHYNGPVTWMDRSNQYMLNELWLYAGHAANNDGEGLALGWRTDFLYGASARLTTSAGLEDHINKSNTNMGLAIPNLYIDAAYNDLRMKIGHFISPVGYYTVGTYQNFFNTIPYTYQWGEPFTHTGILPAYQATDNLVIGTGFTRGWDNSSNFNPHMGYIGTATYSNLLKEGDALAYVNMYSEEPDGAFSGAGQPALPQYPSKPQFAGRYFQTLVYSRPLNDKWSYVAQSDFGYQSNAATAALNSAGAPNSGHARWYGINQYIYYKHNNQWSWGFNFEWFRDEEGFRVGGFLPNYPNTTNGGVSQTAGWGSSNATGAFAGGFAGSFYQMTMGPRWTPMPNLVIRPNARFDWYAGPNGNVTGANGVSYAHPYDNGRRTNQGLLMTDIILVF